MYSELKVKIASNNIQHIIKVLFILYRACILLHLDMAENHRFFDAITNCMVKYDRECPTLRKGSDIDN